MCKLNEILREIYILHMYIVEGNFFYTWRKTVSTTGQVVFSKYDVFSQKKKTIKHVPSPPLDLIICH